jgi:phenylpropionate dioxygenase-like ring-hydroxylating dioxygenase large terminal subunit
MEVGIIMSMQPAALAELIARQRPGWSLAQPFYTSPEIYEFERRGWLGEQWYVLGHVCEIREPGSYIVRELLGESLIIVRHPDGSARGFFNVCRHRGSRICDHDGRAVNLVCPYHAWSYRLDGSLRAAPALPQGIDSSELGLRTVPVREIGGILFGSLKGDPRKLDRIEEEAAPVLRYHGIPDARIAARRSYPTHGNWKLVIENFIECYHCFPCHPEFCGVMNFVEVVARQATPQASAAWEEWVAKWLREEADPNSPVKQARVRSLLESDTFGVYHEPIGGGRKTQSKDGAAVAPLMGKMQRFDGGISGFRMEPFIYFACANDHAVMFQFLPSGTETTEVLISWLVNGSSVDSEVDVERMIWLWDVTTVQDKAIIERNARGVRSLAYVPGPYSTLESWPARFVAYYLDGLLGRTKPTLRAAGSIGVKA